MIQRKLGTRQQAEIVGVSNWEGGEATSENHSAALSRQQTAQRFDLLATESKEYAVFLIDTTGAVLCWNPGAERLFGYRSDEIVGQHFSRFFSPEDICNGQPEHEIKVTSDQGRADSVRWQVRKDGTGFWCQSIVTPLFDEKKQAVSYGRVMHDLTDSQASEAQRKRADGLADANRNKEEFMALLSHELRSPLSPIVNALSILRQMRTNDPIIENDRIPSYNPTTFTPGRNCECLDI